MDLQLIAGSEAFKMILLPLLIFLLRIVDVSIGTLRIIYISRGMKILATVCGFFEVLIWLVAISQVFQHLSSWEMFLAYASGFAIGNYVGITIENKLALGFLAIRIITQKNAARLLEHLRSEGYGVTNVPAFGATGKVHVIFTVVKRKAISDIIKVIMKYNPKAFYSIEEIKAVKEGVFPHPIKRGFASLHSIRKLK